MRSLAEQTYRQIFLAREKWDNGFAATKEGRLKKGRGWLAAVMRFVRRIWRAWVSSPSDFESAVRRQLGFLAEKLQNASPSELMAWRFEIVRRGPQRDPFVGEAHFFQTLYKTIKIIQKHPIRTQGWDILESGLVALRNRRLTRDAELTETEPGGILKLIEDPRAQFDKVVHVQTNLGDLKLTDNFLQDFHRSDMYINNVLSYGKCFPNKTIADLANTLDSLGYTPRQIEGILRFCSQASQSNAADRAFSLYPLPQLTALKAKEVEYYIGRPEDGLACRFGKKFCNADAAIRIAATTVFKFSDSFDSGDMTYHIHNFKLQI